jgi:citrate lyase subunit beta/citryl-CoA lyase
VAPKVSSPEDLAHYAGALPPGVRLWAMIETCEAVLRLHELAKAAQAARNDLWIVGPNDLVKEMRCRPGPDRAPLLPALSLTVMAAHAYGLDVLDGVYNDIPDLDGLAGECRQAVELGFDGKTLIHPSHLDIANRAFTPDAAEVARARAIADAFAASENAGQGVLKVDGRMVERLHLAQAERLIAISDAIAARE